VSTPTVLISGAGVAGPMLAHRLAEAGWATTVVEDIELLDEPAAPPRRRTAA
jgi:2-polyprenyl-6-methoxyphenol hydroxylase-like FAD-dependent oxidoreductase